VNSADSRYLLRDLIRRTESATCGSASVWAMAVPAKPLHNLIT